MLTYSPLGREPAPDRPRTRGRRPLRATAHQITVYVHVLGYPEATRAGDTAETTIGCGGRYGRPAAAHGLHCC